MRIGLSRYSSVLSALTLTAVGCGGGSVGTPPGGGAPTMKMVGPAGGALSSSDGKLAVSIPPGALAANVTITTEPAAAPAIGAVGTVYEIGPSGTQFAMPVTLTLRYDAASLGSASESSLRVATFAGGAWQLLPGAVVDKQAKTVSGVTTHLSPYAIVTEAVGKTCATVQMAFSCADPGTAGGGSSAAACEPPTCAGATNACAQYPGSAMDSCVDGEKGYTASCCFAPSAPICFAAAAGFGCTDAGGGGGGGGAGGGSCPPPPTCATATNACAGFPGATLQNCTENSNGYTGACCFQPDVPVCVAVNAARGCATSPGGGTGDCPPPPRCADGNPCARYVGATAQSCSDTTDGFQATCCFAVGTIPVASGSGSGGGTDVPDGGAPAIDAGSAGGKDAGATGGAGAGTGTTGAGGAGGTTSGGICAEGASCATPGIRCGDASPTSCTECTCGADGHYTCMPCPDKPDGGGAGATTGAGGAGGSGGMTGGGTCAEGASCATPGIRCGDASPTSCTECTCGADGYFTCMPCPDKPDGGGAGATTGTGGAGGSGGMTGGGTCAEGASCPTPGVRCGLASPAGCMECTCGADGYFTCMPCPDKPDGGSGTGAAPGTGGIGGTSGTASGPCQVMPMPSPDVGLPCGVTESCPDGSNYRVRCDGTTGACTCFANGVPQAAMPTMSCSGFNPSAALVACGFPDGKI